MILGLHSQDITKNMSMYAKKAPTKDNQKLYKTIDLFARIGGIRLGFSQTRRVQNVFCAEIDRYSCTTYEANFGENPMLRK